MIDADKKYWRIDFYSMELEDTGTRRGRFRMIRLNQIMGVIEKNHWRNLHFLKKYAVLRQIFSSR